MFPTRRVCAASVALAACALIASSFSATAQAVSSPEARAARAFEQARKEGPAALRVFCSRCRRAAICTTILVGPCMQRRSSARRARMGFAWTRAAEDGCRTSRAGLPAGEPAAKDVPANQHLYDELIDAFSMRTFVPVDGRVGTRSFLRYLWSVWRRQAIHGEWIDEVASRRRRRTSSIWS
jgi:adenosine deaminase